MLTTQRLVQRTLAQFGDRIAVIDERGALTYRALHERSGRLANALVGLGASLERPAAVLLPNEVAVIELDVACMRAGVTRVAIGTRLSGDECRFILEHSGSAVLVTNCELYERIGPVPADIRVLLVDLTESWGSSAVESAYERVLSAASSHVCVAEVRPEDPAYIIYTSGTTGRPKGATQSHGGRVAALVNMLASEIKADYGSGMVHCGPLSHGSGSKVLTFLALGARNILLRRFDPERLAYAVRAHGGSHSFLVPTMLQTLLDQGPAVRDAVRAMRQLSFGGAPITDALFGRSVEELGPILTQIYGTSEAPHPLTVLQPSDYLAAADPAAFGATAGRLSVGVDARFVGEDGHDVAPGEEGELWVRSPHVMTGYWRDAAATGEVLTADRWYATGDVAMVDQQGFVYLRDRKRDLIITGGLNVYPSEVERVLADHPGVREVAVVGYPDERWGESVLACIVPSASGKPDPTDLLRWLDGRIAGYKKPRRIEFLEDLPKGSTNKVLKRELRALFWTQRDGLTN